VLIVVHEIEVWGGRDVHVEMIARPFALTLRRTLFVVVFALCIGVASNWGMAAGAGHGERSEFQKGNSDITIIY
jgi:hypothetical protein